MGILGFAPLSFQHAPNVECLRPLTVESHIQANTRSTLEFGNYVEICGSQGDSTAALSVTRRTREVKSICCSLCQGSRVLARLKQNLTEPTGVSLGEAQELQHLRGKYQHRPARGNNHDSSVAAAMLLRWLRVCIESSCLSFHGLVDL